MDLKAITYALFGDLLVGPKEIALTSGRRSPIAQELECRSWPVPHTLLDRGRVSNSYQRKASRARDEVRRRQVTDSVRGFEVIESCVVYVPCDESGARGTSW